MTCKGQECEYFKTLTDTIMCVTGDCMHESGDTNGCLLVIEQQSKFVSWLKAEGIYRAQDSAATMQSMFKVWQHMNKPKGV